MHESVKSHADFGVSMNVLASSKEGETFESELRILEPQRREVNWDASMEYHVRNES